MGIRSLKVLDCSVEDGVHACEKVLGCGANLDIRSNAISLNPLTICTGEVPDDKLNAVPIGEGFDNRGERLSGCGAPDHCRFIDILHSRCENLRSRCGEAINQEHNGPAPPLGTRSGKDAQIEGGVSVLHEAQALTFLVYEMTGNTHGHGGDSAGVSSEVDDDSIAYTPFFEVSDGLRESLNDGRSPFVEADVSDGGVVENSGFESCEALRQHGVGLQIAFQGFGMNTDEVQGAVVVDES
jgi:hypothetical protein